MHALIRTAVTVGLLLAPTLASAQLPTVAQVYDRYAEAVGGRDTWRGVQGRTETGTADITFAGLSGSYTRHSALPNKTRLLIDLGVVTIDNGFDGERGWMVQGGPPQRMSPEEEKELAETQKDGAHFLDPSRYAKAEVVGRETFAGVDAYKVAVTSSTGQQLAEYFDAATGVRLGTVRQVSGTEVRSVFSDYKAFEGRKVPTRIIQNNGQGDVVITINSVTFGVPDEAVFKSPLGAP